jgi:hypothetical protein
MFADVNERTGCRSIRFIGTLQQRAGAFEVFRFAKGDLQVASAPVSDSCDVTDETWDFVGLGIGTSSIILSFSSTNFSRLFATASS